MGAVQENQTTSGIKISFVGNDDMVSNITKQLRLEGIKVKAFRDGDRGPDKSNSIYSLPGTMAPEKEVFSCPAVQSWLLADHGIDFADWLIVNSDIDFHDWPEALATEVSKSVDGLWEQACATYARSLDPALSGDVVNSIELNT